MKKIWKTVSLTAAVSSLLLLSGCHGAKEAKSLAIPDTFDTSRSYEITFWAKNDTNKAQTDIYKKAISDFEALYPNIKVDLRLYTDYGKIYNDVITNIATDTTPNVCITYPDHIATYLSGEGTVVPLDPFFTNEKYGFGGSELAYDGPTKEDMIDKYLEECTFSGRTYAVPFMRSTEACYVNKTYVENLGYTLPDTLTWDFIWEVSEAAMKKNADGAYVVNGQDVLIPFIYKSTDNMMIQMLRQKNAGYSSADGKIELFNDTTTELLLQIAAHVKSGAFSTFKISGYPANFLNAGQCIFAVDSTAGATWMGEDAPLSDISADAVTSFDTEVMTVPQFDPEHPQMISQGPSICIFNKSDSQEVLASWLFTQYLLTNNVQISYSETEGYIPVTKKAQKDAGYQDYLSRCGEDTSTHYDVKIKAAELLLSHIDDTFITPVFNGSASLRDAAGQLIETVAKSVRRKKDVNDNFIQSVYSDVTSLYHLDQVEASSGGKADLGPLPKTAIALLGGLIATWMLILLYLFTQIWKKRRRMRR